MIALVLGVALFLGHDVVAAQGRRIQEASFLTVGGIEQWVTIRGDDPTNAKQYFGWSRPIRRFLPAADTGWFSRMEKDALASGETEASMNVIGEVMMASRRCDARPGWDEVLR